MTRLDPVGEPSMEEILASIRRIIAEDPPGSRPEPEMKLGRSAAAASPAIVQPGLSSASADIGAPGGDRADGPNSGPPSAQADDAGQLAKAASASFFSHRPAFDAPHMPTTTVTAAPSRAASPPSPFDIDAQVADVLGAPPRPQGTMPPAPNRSLGAPASGSPGGSKDSVQAALDSLGSAGGPTEQAGFAISRDGYIPGTGEGPAAGQSGAAWAPAERTPDPFEFKLGPSPFARKGAPQVTADQSGAPAERNADAFGSFIPTREAATPTQPGHVSARAQATPFGALKPAEKPAQPDFSAMGSSFATPQEPSAPPFPSPANASADESVAKDSNPAEAKSADLAPGEDPFGEITFRPQLFSSATPPSAAAEIEIETSSEVSPHAVLEQLVRAAGAYTSPAAQAVEPSASSDDLKSGAPAPAEANEATEPVSEADTAVRSGLDKPAEAAPMEHGALSLSDIAPRSSETMKVAHEGDISALLTELPSETDSVDVEVVEPELEDASHAQVSIDQRELDADANMESYAASNPAPSNDGRSLVPRSHDSDRVPAPRTMEDTVAELLRPLLKTWLAENMPKIVERALRKELDDSKSAQHKPAAE